MLVIAAIMSQFSAAIADTLGAGGLLTEESRRRITPRIGYLIIIIGACVLVWSTDIFDIIALASRAFAAYYLMQTLVALQVAIHMPKCFSRWICIGQFSLASISLTWVVIYALPAG